MIRFLVGTGEDAKFRMTDEYGLAALRLLLDHYSGSTVHTDVFIKEFQRGIPATVCRCYSEAATVRVQLRRDDLMARDALTLGGMSPESELQTQEQKHFHFDGLPKPTRCQSHRGEAAEALAHALCNELVADW